MVARAVVEVLVAAMEVEPIAAVMPAVSMVAVINEAVKVVKSLFMHKQLVRYHMYQIYIYFCWLLLLAKYDVCIQYPPSLHILTCFEYYFFHVSNSK